MRTQDRARFVRAIQRLESLYDKRLSKDSIDLYWEMFKDHDIDQFLQACQKHVERSTEFPKPSDLVKHFKQDHTALKSLAWRAWQEVSKEIARQGRYGGIQYDHPAMQAGLASVSCWSDLCEMTNSQLAYEGNRFTEAFIAHCKITGLMPKIEEIKNTFKSEGTQYSYLTLPENIKKTSGPTEKGRKMLASIKSLWGSTDLRQKKTHKL